MENNTNNRWLRDAIHFFNNSELLKVEPKQHNTGGFINYMYKNSISNFVTKICNWGAGIVNNIKSKDKVRNGFAKIKGWCDSFWRCWLGSIIKFPVLFVTCIILYIVSAFRKVLRHIGKFLHGLGDSIEYSMPELIIYMGIFFYTLLYCVSISFIAINVVYELLKVQYDVRSYLFVSLAIVLGYALSIYIGYVIRTSFYRHIVNLYSKEASSYGVKTLYVEKEAVSEKASKRMGFAGFLTAIGVSGFAPVFADHFIDDDKLQEVYKSVPKWLEGIGNINVFYIIFAVYFITLTILFTYEMYKKRNLIRLTKELALNEVLVQLGEAIDDKEDEKETT